MIGLLAETARTGALREYHARLLAALAARGARRAPAPSCCTRRSSTARSPGNTAQRQELVALLGLFGIGTVLDELRDGAPATAAAMTQIALRASGFDEMSRRLRIQLGSRSDVMNRERS